MGCGSSKPVVDEPQGSQRSARETHSAPTIKSPAINSRQGRSQYPSVRSGNQHPVTVPSAAPQSTDQRNIRKDNQPQDPSARSALGDQTDKAKISLPSQRSPSTNLKPTASVDPLSWSTILQEVQEGHTFSIRIISHKVRTINSPCWSYITEGLENVNQNEIVFTIRQRPSDTPAAYPPAPISWIRWVHLLACRGVHVQVGEMCDINFYGSVVEITMGHEILRLESHLWQDMSNLGMLIHSSAGHFDFTPHRKPPPRYDYVLALTKAEAVAARKFGVSRVVAHIGQSVLWFPKPIWNDRDRSDAITMTDLMPCMMSRLKLERVLGLSVTEYHKRLLLEVADDIETWSLFRSKFRSYRAGTPLGFESYISEDANAGAVWRNDYHTPRAYTGLAGPDMTDEKYVTHYSKSQILLDKTNFESLKTNVSFLMICPGQDTDKVETVEDGRIRKFSRRLKPPKQCSDVNILP